MAASLVEARLSTGLHTVQANAHLLIQKLLFCIAQGLSDMVLRERIAVFALILASLIVWHCHFRHGFKARQDTVCTRLLRQSGMQCQSTIVLRSENASTVATLLIGNL